jgi:diguanylate cyclase (GGDEF)-like protein
MQRIKTMGSRILALVRWPFRRNGHPTIIFGIILIITAWIAVDLKVKHETEEMQRGLIGDVENYAILFEQDVLRTATELDRIIKFLRRSYERSDYTAEWSSLISDDFTVNARAVQIAIIDHSGTMVSSTAMLHPPKRVDLSDREHFKVHVTASVDQLFVSAPVLGRASGKWSVQFTRRFTAKDGTFAGVIVVSLDPEMLVATYDQLKTQHGWGFALIGSDQIIRSGAGLFAAQMGKKYVQGAEPTALKSRAEDMTVSRERVNTTWQLVGSRSVRDYPLFAIASVNDKHSTGALVGGIDTDYIVVAIFTALVIFAMAASAAREYRHVKRITALAHHDSLTGLCNRHTFRQQLKQACQMAPHERIFALHLIDLDKFKPVNDTFGHAVGDELLIAVAQRLKSSIRSTDSVFRLGGDEFALIQSNCSTQDQAGATASRICSILSEPFEISGNRVLIGASIGIASALTDGADSNALLQAADMALYLAKGEGRATFRYFNQDLNLAHLRRRQLEMELSVAADRNELVLHYQPKVNLDADRSICGYEALVRWRHPVSGLIPPSEFISVAEETGLIVPIGDWILERACTEMLSHPGAATVAVNCSPVQFSRGNVADAAKRALAKSGLPAHRLEIEITESTLMRSEATILTQLHELRALGIRISLDDFGTGYSSLSYLHTYPVDCIKIDRSFVKTLGEEVSAGPIIRAIIAMANELQISTVAEGVETTGQLEELILSGCTAVQGYLFSPPRPAAELWLANTNGENIPEAA